MYRLRLILFTIITICCVACAGSAPPPTEKRPQDLRRSIRQLNRGTKFYIKGCYEKAAILFQRAHERYAAADNVQGTADALNSLANTYYRLDDMPSAVLIYDEAIDYYRLLNDLEGHVRALTNKSATLAATGMFDEAEAVLNQADELAGRKGIFPALRLKSRAILKLKTGDLKESKNLLSKVIYQISSPDSDQYASAQYTMGYVLLADQQPKAAMAYLDRALEADRTAGAYFGMAQDLEAMGDCHEAMDQHDKAVAYYKRSIKIFALLNRTDNVQQLISKLVDNATEAKVDIRATLHWVKQWLAGQREVNICR